MRPPRTKHVLGCVLTLLLCFPGCAGPKRAVDVTAAPGQKVNVDVIAKSFAFDPAVIVARAGDTLVLRVKNVSGEKHNLTVKDPTGKIIESQDLPGHQTVTMEVPLPTAGIYPLYCDVDFHAGLGMKGKIEAR